MSTSKHVTVWCDDPDCAEWTGGSEALTADALRLAKREGWKRGPGGDFCPKHDGMVRVHVEGTSHWTVP